MNSSSAFSLVELSIVLVILGLLTGGILTGQSLIHAAELRSVTTEFQTYQAAVNTFKSKYLALPGDMRNATSFWGEAHATPATCATTASTGQETCDGDGNGVVDTSTASHELFRFWQHLANAQLITGTYPGITDGSTTFSATADNSPPSKVSNVIWFIDHWGEQVGNATRVSGTYNHLFQVGEPVADAGNYTAAFTPEESWNIDNKIDDGLPPYRGKMVIRLWDDCTRGTSHSDSSAEYLLNNNDSKACVLIFRNIM